ncbi:MAG: hypothetical protein V4560_11490 [Bacteroidota bacterium]
MDLPLATGLCCKIITVGAAGFFAVEGICSVPKTILKINAIKKEPICSIPGNLTFIVVIVNFAEPLMESRLPVKDIKRQIPAMMESVNNP